MKNRSRSLIAILDPSKAYVVKDNIEHAALHNIPLWMFGFLYSFPDPRSKDAARGSCSVLFYCDKRYFYFDDEGLTQVKATSLEGMFVPLNKAVLTVCGHVIVHCLDIIERFWHMFVFVGQFIEKFERFRLVRFLQSLNISSIVLI